MNRDHHALELDKILELLAGETSCEDAAAAARELEPSPSLSAALRQMEDTVAAYLLTARYGGPSFGGIKNVVNALRRAGAGASLSPRELLDIGETLRVIRSLSEWGQHNGRSEGPRENEAEGKLDDRFDALTPNKYLEERIQAVFVSEEEIADTASPALHDIRRKMRSASSRIREQLDKMIRSPAYQKVLQDPIVTIRDGRFVVPVKSEHRGEVPGLVHDTSSSGSTVFVEPMPVVEANNELRVLRAKEEAEIDRILAELSAEAGSFADGIIADYRIAVELNLIFAKARLAYKMKAGIPQLTDDRHIVLKKARHPLLDPKKAVPIDVELGGAFDTLVITGPNTGGKTVTLKTIGLLTLMAMCGLMPPAGDGSRLSVFDSVLADIGDEQSIEQSLSTFSAHMTNLIRILKEADSGSLVLTDELGAGTDPVEGAALATAILERLREQGARVASTTHYAELKVYALHTPGVENGSCEFDVATLRPTYRLLVGVPGRSNAFAISERLGMEPGIVERARELVSSENQRLEDVVSQLETRRQELEEQLRITENARAAALRSEEEAAAKTARLEKEKERETERAKAEARRILDRARAEAQQLMDELDEIRKQKNAADFAAKAGQAKSRLRSRLRSAEEAADPVREKRPDVGYVLPRPLKAGDTVLLVELDKQAVVLTPPDSGGNVEVQAGIIRTRVNVKSLRLLDGPAVTASVTPRTRTVRPSQVQAARGGVRSRMERDIHTELDLRGMTTEEALLETDRFLDDAVLSGIETVTIIHGKGTGALRSAVQTHLRSHPSVAEFRLGTYGEGENGVTVVKLK